MAAFMCYNQKKNGDTVMKIDFSELGNYFFDISDIFAVRQTDSGSTKFVPCQPRPTAGLLFFSQTVGICYQDDIPPIYVPKGSLVYLPRNSYYIWENSPADGLTIQENLLFEFNLSLADVTRGKGEKKELSRSYMPGESIAFGDHVRIVTTKYPMLYRKLFSSLIDTFHQPSFSPLAVFSAAYELFTALSRNCARENEASGDSELIRRGMRLLEDEERGGACIAGIAAECSVSVGYFERLFRASIGMTPAEYRGIHRINRIKMYLHNEKTTLEEIAERMGFCDSGYLCRLFKKKTGMTPKEYRRLYLSSAAAPKPES